MPDRPPARQVSPQAWAILACGLCVSVLLGGAVRQEIRKDTGEFFENAADRMTLTVNQHLDTLSLVLRSAAGLISASDEVTRDDWRRYVEQLELHLNLPGVQGVGYALLIPPEQLAAHESQVRAEGFPDYRVRPAEPRGIYSTILYLEPFDARNQRAFGYDMYSEPVRRAAMNAARDSGQAQLTAQVELLQETGEDVQAGTLMYFPVYRPALAPVIVGERQLQLQGWTYSPLRMKNLMEGVLQDWQEELTSDLRFSVYDGSDADPAALLYRSNENAAYVPLQTHGEPTHHHSQIDFNGRDWLLVYDFDPAAAGFSLQPAWYTFAGSLVISLLLFGLRLSLDNTRGRAEAIANSMTADIRVRDQQLQESEFRWKYALEGAGDGVWDWDMGSNQAYFTPRLKEMLGFRDNELVASFDAWKHRVHPDDLPQVMSDLADYLEGRSPLYRNEHRVLCKDGSYLWIMDRGTVVQRDTKGKPLRMIGTHTNIEQRKQNEVRLRETLATLQRLELALDQLDTYVFLKDTESRYTYANKYCLELVGTTADALPGSSDFDFFPPEIAQRLREIDLRVLAGENSHEEITMGSGSEQRVFIELKTPLRELGESGRIIGICGISTDITARKRLEATLQQGQHDLEQAQRIARVGSWNFDFSTQQVQWTEQLYLLFGVSMSSPAPSYPELEKMLTPESWRQVDAAVTKTSKDGTPYELEVEHIMSDGIRGWVLVRGEAVRDPNGDIVGLQGIAQDITQRKQAEQRIAQLTSFHAALSACNKLLISCRTAEEIYRQTCDIFVQHGGLTMAWFGLVENAGVKVRNLYSTGSGTDYLDDIEINIDPGDPYGQGATGTAIRENRPVWVDNFRSSTITAPWQQRGAKYGWASSAALPISRGGKPIGAVTFYSTQRGSYDTEIRSLLLEISRIVSYALDKLDAEALAYEGEKVLEKVFLQTVGLATKLVELRDPYTAGHVRKVSALSEAIGAELGFDAEGLQGLRVAGLLYDIGKILIPAEILSKPGRLTGVEHQLIQQHPRAGFELLQNVEFPWPVAQVAQQHHERMDGSGYPLGLKGESILLEARIVGTADLVLAMCSHRPYRAALPLESALAEIENGKGSRYDPAVVDACLRLFRDGRFTL